MKRHVNNFFVFFLLFGMQHAHTQSMGIEGIDSIDKEFINSLPESVRGDILSEMKKSNEDVSDSLQKRPSSELQKVKTVQDWENFKKSQYNKSKSDRYGIRLFNTMQSSFMPLNEPNFGNNYIVDYGDFISIEIFGSSRSIKFKAEVGRDGSIVLEDIGKGKILNLEIDKIMYE